MSCRKCKAPSAYWYCDLCLALFPETEIAKYVIKRKSRDAVRVKHDADRLARVAADQKSDARIDRLFDFDFYVDDNCDPETVVANRELFEKVGCIRATLDRRTLLVLDRFENGGSLEEVGKGFGISRERVRQIVKGAARKIRSILEQEMTYKHRSENM